MKTTPEIELLKKVRNDHEVLWKSTQRIEYYSVVSSLTVALKILQMEFNKNKS